MDDVKCGFGDCLGERVLSELVLKIHILCNTFGKNSYNIRILSQILTSSCAKSAIFKIRRTLKPEFLDNFGA